MRPTSLRPTRPTSSLKPLRCAGSAAQAKVRIDDIDIGLMPTEFAGALLERVLQPQALLIADDLVWRGLANIDDRFARQMSWFDQFGLHERPPPKLRRRLDNLTP